MGTDLLNCVFDCLTCFHLSRHRCHAAGSCNPHAYGGCPGGWSVFSYLGVIEAPGGLCAILAKIRITYPITSRDEFVIKTGWSPPIEGVIHLGLYLALAVQNDVAYPLRAFSPFSRECLCLGEGPSI